MAAPTNAALTHERHGPKLRCNAERKACSDCAELYLTSLLGISCTHVGTYLCSAYPSVSPMAGI